MRAEKTALRFRALLDFLQRLEEWERHAKSSPVCFAARQHIEHAFRYIGSPSTDIPLNWQENLFMPLPPEAIAVETTLGFSIVFCARDDWRFVTQGYYTTEASETILVARASDFSDMFFDVGANLGYFSLLYATSTQGKSPCFAFEPISDVFSRLVRAVEINKFTKSVFPFQSAIGSRRGEARIHVNRYGSGGNSLIDFANSDMEFGYDETVEVTSLDSFIQSHSLSPRNGLLKIDVEGAENDVLRGARSYLTSAFAPIVLLETFGQTRDLAVLSELSEFGYEIFGIKEYAQGESLLFPAFQKHQFMRSKIGNYMAFQPRHAELREYCSAPESADIFHSSQREERIETFLEKSIESALSYARSLNKDATERTWQISLEAARGEKDIGSYLETSNKVNVMGFIKGKLETRFPLLSRQMRTILRLRKVFVPKYFLSRVQLKSKFRSDLKGFRTLSAALKDERFAFDKKRDLHQIYELQGSTPFDPHYLFHTSWAARLLAKNRPTIHYDYASDIRFATMVSAFVPVVFSDYRPLQVDLNGLKCKSADLIKLEESSGSIRSLSCMHVIEHIGLGRYADALDPLGDIKAIGELKRVLAPGGIYISLCR